MEFIAHCILIFLLIIGAVGVVCTMLGMFEIGDPGLYGLGLLCSMFSGFFMWFFFGSKRYPPY